MKRFVVLDKRIGQTPLAALGAWKAARPAYASVPACYAGRLDPMASGKLLILLGEECKRQKAYIGLDKEYEIEVLLDAGSDTGDALGVAAYAGKDTHPSRSALAAALRAEEGVHLRKYPSYSSKTVHGKALFLHALEGTLGGIDIPEHYERIYRIRMQGIERVPSAALASRIEAFLAQVPKTDEPSKALGADFRIESVRASWAEFFRKAGTRDFAIIRLRVACGAGAYMRSLASRIGKTLGTDGIALAIRRTRIGKRFGSFWLKSY